MHSKTFQTTNNNKMFKITIIITLKPNPTLNPNPKPNLKIKFPNKKRKNLKTFKNN